MASGIITVRNIVNSKYLMLTSWVEKHEVFAWVEKTCACYNDYKFSNHYISETVVHRK